MEAKLEGFKVLLVDAPKSTWEPALKLLDIFKFIVYL